MNYEELNNILNHEIRNPFHKIHIKNLDEISKYAKIIIDYPDNFQPSSYTTKIDLNESIRLVSLFLKTVSVDYENQFQNVLREQPYYNCPSYEFKKSEDSISKVYSDGHVLISYQENLEDAFNILHETIHKFSQAYKENNSIKDFYGEVTPITMEFLFQDFLLKKGILSPEEINLKTKERIRSTYFDASDVLFEYHLLNLYQVNGTVNEEIIEEYIESLPHESTEYQIFKNHYKEYLKDILRKKCFNFPIRQRYVIGTIFGIYFSNKIKNDPSFIFHIHDLIKIFGDTQSNVKRNINILIKNKNPISIMNIEMEKELKKIYIKELEKYENKKEKSI